MISQFKSLPKNWILTKIEDICTNPQYGYTTKASQGGNLKLLRTTDITSGRINWNKVPYCTKNPDDTGKYLLKDGDIVISRAGSVGVSYLIKDTEKAIFASYLIRFKPLINKRYFKCFLDSPFYWNSISEKKLGIAVPNVNANKLKSIIIPLSPLEEQNRIVEKIEELFSDLDKATEDLKKSQEQLKIYRQAVLNAAFEGKLTEEWSKKNISRLAEEVLKIKNENIDELFKIPKSWKWLKILQIGEVETGTTPRKNVKSNYGQDYPFYKPTDLEAGINVRKAREYLSKRGLSKARFLPKNSILVTCIGATIGKTGIIRLPGASNQQINAIIPYKFANPNFIYYQVISPYFQEQIISKSSSTTLPILNKSRFKELLIVMATKEEQEQIVQEVESRLSVCDKLEETVQQSLEKIEYLRQSILKKAFEGKLVQQDPYDESAEKLLERIKQEKVKLELNNKKRKKR